MLKGVYLEDFDLDIERFLVLLYFGISILR